MTPTSTTGVDASTPASASAEELTIRDLDSQDDFLAAGAIQRRTWGEDFAEHVPPSMFLICRKTGGVAAGAFDVEGQMVGMVYGLTGVREGKLMHWSHMLAVDAHWRDRGVGKRLKRFQREQLVDRGVYEMQWTYDPLVARNAYLNINRLRCRMCEYVIDIYGDGAGSTLHRGIGTDRLIVAWDLRAEAAPPPQRDAAWDEAPILGTEVADPSVPLPENQRVRIEIPSDIQELKATDGALALRYRHATRRALRHYLDRGYSAVRLQRGATAGSDSEARCTYELEAS